MKNLKKREKILLGVTAAIVLLAALYFVQSMTGGQSSLSTAELRRLRTDKTKELEQKRLVVGRVPQYRAKMAAWEDRSLPTQADVAGASYQQWLRALGVELKLRNTSIVLGAAHTRKGVYTPFPFRIECVATLDQVTRFLHAFYSAPHLHQIRLMSLEPLEEPNDFKVSIAIEAVALPTAKRPTTLAEGKAERLAHGALDEYLKTIVHRRMEGDRVVTNASGVFTPYSPPPPPPVARRDTPPPPRRVDPPPPPAFDHTKQTFLNAIVSVDGQPKIWLEVRTLGKKFELGVGEKFEIGKVRGSVRQVYGHEAEIELDGKSRRVTVGSSLGEPAVVQSDASKGTGSG
jgi:hypothetical protein